MGNPHVFVIPYPAQGHVVALMELSQSLVKHGCKITFVNTDYNHKRLTSALTMKDGIGNQIHLVSVPLEQEHPEIMNQPDKRFEAILWFMPQKVEELIERINATESDKITCVVADHLLGWAMKIAVEKGIRGASFGAVAATHLVLRSSLPKLIDEGIINDEGIPTKKQVFQLLPTMPAMSTAHIGWTCLGSLKVQKLYFENVVRNNPATKLADWVLCNSAYDLEPAAFDFDPKFTPIGPLLTSNQFGDLAGSFLPEDFTCLEWLDQQPLQSVIYVAFGSSTTFERTQFDELAMALELSNRPFLWVVRPGITEEINEAYFKGFQERVSTRGRIISWAPQQKVLGHPSIACFLSHCGWNSTMEGVSNGIPFLCWPYYADQFHNENYICNVWKVGLGFNRNEKGKITQEEIKNKVDELLDNGEYKANAINLKERVMNSIKEGGGSYNNFKHFVEWLKA